MTQPLTILHAHSGNLYGGVETMLVTLARQPGPFLHRFALCFEGRLAGQLRGAGVPVSLLGDVRFSRPWSVLAARPRLARIIRAHWPAVVICHSPWSLAAFGPVARRQGLPLVLWAHDAFTGRHRLERLARWSATPDLAICNSQYTRAGCATAFPSTRTEVSYYPVSPPPSFDPARRPAKREAHGASPETVVITLAARLERGKGHAVLLDVLASLRDRPGWAAWIVGGAERRSADIYRAELERRANEARIADRVHFLGQRDDVASLLWASDIYCQPNTQPEPFGLSFIAALYAGLPVVTTDLGGAREIVTPACGMLVPAGDAAALRSALERMMGEADLRERLRAAAPARAAALCAPGAAVQRLSEVLGGVVRG